MGELIRAFGAAVLWLGVFALITSAVRRLLDLGRADAMLAAYVFFCVFQVLLVRLLDLLGLLTTAATLASYAVTATGLVLLHFRLRGRTSGSARAPLAEADLTGADFRLVRRIALGCIVAVLAGVAVFSLISPVHVWDVLAYHMPMVASYIQYGSLDAWPTQDLRQVYRVNAGELQLLNLALLSGSDAWIELTSGLALAAVLAGSFALARAVLRHTILPYAVAAVVLTAPQIILSATTAKNDLTFTAALLACFYWTILTATSDASRVSRNAAFAALSASLAAATKVMGMNVLGAAGLLLLVWVALRRVPLRVLGVFVLIAVLTVGLLAGPVYWSNLTRDAAVVGVAPEEVMFTTGLANIPAAARYYLYDLAFKRLVVLQMFEHDLSHYGYFFPFLLTLGCIAALRQVVVTQSRRAATAGLTLLAAALFVSVIAVRLPIRWDQRFMVWLVPTAAILAASLGERLHVRYILVLTTAAAAFALTNLFLALSNEADGLFTRSATHLARTGSLARYVDVPSRHYREMIEGYDLLDAAPGDSILYVGSDDAWMYPAWGPGFTRHVRGVQGEEDTLGQVRGQGYRFVVIERSAAPRLSEAAEREARSRGYRTLFEGGTRIILQRIDALSEPENRTSRATPARDLR